MFDIVMLRESLNLLLGMGCVGIGDCSEGGSVDPQPLNEFKYVWTVFRHVAQHRSGIRGRSERNGTIDGVCASCSGGG